MFVAEFSPDHKVKAKTGKARQNKFICIEYFHNKATQNAFHIMQNENIKTIQTYIV